MIEATKFTLANGLRVLVHEDVTTPMVCVNVLYDVGSRDENPEKTGFAHLFEHLMFGGSENIAHYDHQVQLAGGENNAFTNTDFTNYYLSLPSSNIETAFWLESDRMQNLAFSETSLNVQRNVVIEEFKQRYLNQPYGDSMLLLRNLAYEVHPYRWPTIGKDISHIANATLQEVKDFFARYYSPSNAILCLSGNVKQAEVKFLADKWFASIESREKPNRNLPKEPEQKELKKLVAEKNVPFDSIFIAFHICSRKDKDYHTIDLISDILSNGNSSRLYRRLVKEKNIFVDITAFITGEIDEGLLYISGKLREGIAIETGEKEIFDELNELKVNLVLDYELEKVKNKAEASFTYLETQALSKAINLSFFELLGNFNEINNEINSIKNVSKEQIQQVSQKIFRTENCSVIWYLSNNKK